MRHTFFPVLLLVITSLPVLAQKNPAVPPSKDQAQNIIIHKKGGDKEKTTIVIDGDKITINGKPLKDYKGDIQITENNRNDFGFAQSFPPLPPASFNGGAKSFAPDFDLHQNTAFLGVYTKDNDKGASVSSVVKGSPADKAGLKEGDIITSVNDDKITGADDLMDAVGKHKPEDKISIIYLRNEKENTINIALEKNSQPGFAFRFNDSKNLFNKLQDFSGDWNGNKPRLGMHVQDVETGTGIEVTDVEDEDSPAAKSGLKEEDIITQINGKAIASVKDAKGILADVKPGDNVTISYQRKGSAQTVVIHLPKPLQSSDL